MSKRSTFKPRSPQTRQGSDDLPAQAPPSEEAEVDPSPPPPPPTEPSEPVEGESQIITAQDDALPPKQESPKATPPTPTAEDPNPSSSHPPPPTDQPDAEAVEQGESIGKHVSSVSWRFQSPVESYLDEIN